LCRQVKHFGRLDGFCLNESTENGKRWAGAMLSRPFKSLPIFQDLEGPRKHATLQLTFPILWTYLATELLHLPGEPAGVARKCASPLIATELLHLPGKPAAVERKCRASRQGRHQKIED
jgi:hypothetical protein